MRNFRLAASSIAAFIVFGSCSPLGASDIVTPGFYELGASSQEGQKYEQGRALALRLLGNTSGLDDATAALVARAAENLAAARFYVAADAQGDRQCARVVASLFVTSDFPKSIFICADTRWHVQRAQGLAEEVLAQGFIHEAVHLAGITDECVATLLELKFAQDGLGAVTYGNFRRYSRQCNGLLDAYAPHRPARHSSR